MGGSQSRHDCVCEQGLNSLPYQSSGAGDDICWISMIGQPLDGSALSSKGQPFLPWKNVLGN